MEVTRSMEKLPENFSGTKVALINKGKVLTILRDDKPDISFPGYWDFPGGQRDNNETPMEVAVRELAEELGVELLPDELVWQGIYPAVADPNQKAVFMVFEITDQQLNSIVFGEEGREWTMTPFKDFLENQKAVPGMKARLQDYLNAQNQTEI